jgi:hypothetical protein
MSVQDYYAELQKGMIRAGVHEETEDKILESSPSHFRFLCHLILLVVSLDRNNHFSLGVIGM